MSRSRLECVLYCQQRLQLAPSQSTIYKLAGFLHASSRNDGRDHKKQRSVGVVVSSRTIQADKRITDNQRQCTAK